MDRSRIFFRFAYLVGLKPWDSGVPPPELREVVEGPGALPPGTALDLGCGTGTNCIYLAQHGWTATGVDFTPRPIRAARRKVRQAGVAPTLLVGDVTRLSAIGVDGPFDLLLDIGCFHSIPEGKRDAYVSEAVRVATPGATFLLFAFADPKAPAHAPPEEIERRFGPAFDMVEVRAGDPRLGQTWYRMRRRPAA